ncbi:MAG: polysaccharide biosynthesis protein [Bacillota bacterium]
MHATKNVFTATLILTTANLISKLMGFFYRVFMSNTIGAEGMGLYQLVMPIYALAWSITAAGFTTTISHLTAQEQSKGNTENISKILKQSLVFSFSLSILLGLVLFFGADTIAIHILQAPRTTMSLQFLSFALPFMACGSCLRGYFLGLQSPTIPATSQVLEQTIRIAVVYVLAAPCMKLGLEMACLSAIIGIIFGEFISFLYVVFVYKTHKKSTKNRIKSKGLVCSNLTITKMILTMALPLCATRIVASLLVTIENTLIPQQLQAFGQDSTSALEVYGELTGMAMPLIFLPSACLLAASISLVPEISKAVASQNHDKIKRTVSATFLFTFVLGIGVATIFAIFPREICYIVYNRQNLGELLFPLAFICPFLYAQITIQGLLNGLGEQFFLFVNHLISSVITIGLLLYYMPQYGIPVFFCAMGLSLFVSMMLCLARLYVRTGVFPNVSNCFIRPLLAGCASGLSIRYIIQVSIPSKFLFLCSIASVSLLYVIFLILLGCFSENELGLLLKKNIRK